MQIYVVAENVSLDDITIPTNSRLITESSDRAILYRELLLTRDEIAVVQSFDDNAIKNVLSYAALFGDVAVAFIVRDFPSQSMLEQLKMFKADVITVDNFVSQMETERRVNQRNEASFADLMRNDVMYHEEEDDDSGDSQD